MTRARKTAAPAMWQDNHSGDRGHRLMTRKLADAIPALYANENAADYDTVLAPAKLFSPYGSWTWYITELDPETGLCFGLIDGFEKELGYFDLTELAETTIFGGVPAVERDLYWQPKTLGEIRNGSRENPPRNEDARERETETGEIHPPALTASGEPLFGHAAHDAPDGAGGELPAGDAAASNDDAVDPAGKPDAAGEHGAPDETIITEELKVVLSIRAGHATIGVQRTSSDPHIEEFDGLDMAGLAEKAPAVIERARTKWHAEPRAAQAPAAERETGQKRPEALRLF